MPHALNGDDDVSLIVKTKLTYQHLLRADTGALDVNLPGGRAVTIGGFGNNAVRAFDITDSQHPTEIQTTVSADPQGGCAARGIPGSLRRIVFVGVTFVYTCNNVTLYTI